jgi:hypothetical protein
MVRSAPGGDTDGGASTGAALSKRPAPGLERSVPAKPGVQGQADVAERPGHSFHPLHVGREAQGDSWVLTKGGLLA